MNQQPNTQHRELMPSGTACPFCGHNALKLFLAKPSDLGPSSTELVNIVECILCDAAWQWPLKRTSNESINIFDDAYSTKEVGSYFDRAKRKAIAETQRQFVEKATTHIGRLLDIGCGDGFFVSAMANSGWDVTGIDPALPNALLQESKTSVHYIRGDLHKLPRNEHFDVITIWDVIEHVERPLSLVVDAASWLAPGGLLIIETGNYQSAGRVMSGVEWWNFQADHRWYLAPPQLKRLMLEAGLVDLHLAKQVLRPWWRGKNIMSIPHPLMLIKALIKNPTACFREWQRYHQLSRGAKAWKDWGGLEIMTMIGRRKK